MNEKYEELASLAVTNGYSLERFQEILAKSNYSESDIASASEIYNLKKKGTTPSESQGAEVSTDSTSSSVGAGSSSGVPSVATSQGGDYALGFQQQEILSKVADLTIGAPTAPLPYSTIKEEEDFYRSQNDKEGAIDVARKRKELLDNLNKETNVISGDVVPFRQYTGVDGGRGFATPDAISKKKDELNKQYTSLTGDKNNLIDEDGAINEKSKENLGLEFQRVSYEVYDDVMDKAKQQAQDFEEQDPYIGNVYIGSMVQSVVNQATALTYTLQDMFLPEGTMDQEFQDLRYDQQIEHLANLYKLGVEEDRLQTSATEDLFVQDEDGNFNIGDGFKKIGLGVAQTIPQIAFTIAAPEIALPVLGATSAAGTWVDVRDRADLSTADKISLSVISGAAEYAFERIGIGEIQKARKAIGLIDELPKSTRIARAKDWISQRNKTAGAFVNSRVGGALGSATAEGLEELGVEITNQTAAHLIAGEEFNPYQISDSFLIGFAAGGGTATVPAALAAGYSAIGSAPLLKDRIRIINDIKKFKDLAANPNLSKAERKELELELERSNLELKDLVDREQKFYSSMNEQDQMDILSLNQKIRQKIDLHSKMQSQEGKDKIMREVQELLNEKQSIEKAYGDPFSIVENEDGTVERKPYKDRKRAEKLNNMLNDLGIGQVEDTDESIEDSTVEFTQDTNLEGLVNDFLGDITDAQLEKFGTSRTEIRQALSETRAMFSALKSINPDSKIFIHKTAKAFENATGESALDASGIFLPKESNRNEIHLFAPALAAGTAIHEIGHEIAGQLGGGFVQEFMKGMQDAIQGDTFLSERYGSFLRGYVQEGADLSEIQEEFFAEFLQDLARGNVSIKVEKSLLNKLRGAINKYTGSDLKITDERSTLIEAISRIGEKIARGEDILDDALLATVALEDGMGVAVVNANNTDVVNKKKKRQIITSDEVETYSFKDVVNRVNGRVLLITSDNTGVGNIGTDELYGGLLYSFLPENVRDGVGFASVDTSSVSTVMKFVEAIGSEGQDVAVFVMQQSPSAMLGNYYGMKYFLDAVSKSVSKEQTREVLDNLKSSIVGKKDVIEALKSELPTINQIPENQRDNIDWTQYGKWKGRTAKDKEASQKIYNDFIEMIDSIDELTPEVITGLIDVTSFKFRKALMEFLIPTGYGKEKGSFSFKAPYANKKAPLIKQILAEKGFSQADFFMKYSQPEFAEPTELLNQLKEGTEGDWGYIYSGFITNKNLDYGKNFQDNSGMIHPQFNAKIPSTENFLLDSGYQIDDKFKKVLNYRDSEKKPNYARVSIAGSMFMGTRGAKAQADTVTMANALLSGEKEGLTTQSVIKNTAKKRKRVQENKVQPSKEGTWFVSRDFESVMNEFPDLYKESLDADIDEAKFLQEHGIELYHGGAAFVGGKVEKGKDFSFFASPSKRESEYYFKEYKEGEAALTRFFVSNQDIADEATVRSVMKELGITPENNTEVDVTEEGMLMELIDPNYDSEFYQISDADRKRLYNALLKRGVKVIKFQDNSVFDNYVTNYIVLDPSADAYLSIEDMAEAKDINLDAYIDTEASGTGNETQVTTNNGTYQKMINYFKSIDKGFKKKTFADINGGLGTSNQLKYENGIENYQVIEPFYDRKRFPVYSMTMEDAAKAVTILGLSGKSQSIKVPLLDKLEVKDKIISKIPKENDVFYHGSTNISWVATETPNTIGNTSNAESKYLFLAEKPETAINYSIDSVNGVSRISSESGIASYKIKKSAKIYKLTKKDIEGAFTINKLEAIYDSIKEKGFDVIVNTLDGNNRIILNNSVIELKSINYNQDSIKSYAEKSIKKPHTILNNFVKKGDNFSKLEELVKRDILPSSKLKPDYVEQNGYDIPSESVDYAMSNAVLNVIPGDIRQDVTLNFGRSLKVGGVGILSTRGTDVATNKSNVSLSEDPLEFYVASKYTYQKGFTPNELQAYVQDVLGPDFEVERYNKLSGPAVVIKRVDNSQDLESKFVFQKEGLKPKKRMSPMKVQMIKNNLRIEIERGLIRKGYSVDPVYDRNSTSTISNYQYLIARKGASDVRLYAIRVSDHSEAGSMEIYDQPFKRVDEMNHDLFKQFKRDTNLNFRFTTARVFNAYDYQSYSQVLRAFENQGLGSASSIKGLWNKFSRKTAIQSFIEAYNAMPEEGRDKAFEDMIYDLGFDRATAKEFTKQVANESTKEVTSQEGFGRVIMANIFQATKKNNNILLDKFFGDIEEALRAGKDLQEVMDKYKEDISKGATKEELSVRIAKTMRKLEKSWIDRQSNVKRLIGEANMEAVEDLVVTRAGAGAWAKVQFNKFEKEIYGGLTTEELDALDKIIFAMRVIQIDSNFDAREKKRPEHPLGFTKEKAEASFKSLKMELGTEVFEALEERANKYFDAMRGLFKEAYDAGLVSQGAYEALSSDNYSPRKFLNFVLNPEDGTFKNTDTNSKEFLKELKKGSEGSLIMDSRYLLQVHTRNTQNKIFYNRMVSSLAEQLGDQDLEWIKPSNVKDINVGEPVDLSEPGEESFMFQPTEEKIMRPDPGYKNLYYFMGGQLKALQIKSEYYDELLDLEILAKGNLEQSLDKTLGVLNSILRFNATGAGNPLFFMKDFFRNWLYAIFRSDVYGRSSFTVSSIRMMRDLYSATKDKVLGREDYVELAKHGGLMDFLAVEASPFKNLIYRKGDTMGYIKRGVKKTTEGLTYLSETTEVAFRVAIYKRDLKQRIEDFIAENGHEPTQDDLEAMKFSAARASREILDFSQGGIASKKVDKLLAPYLNVAIQGTRGMVETIRKDPAKFGRFITELGAIAAAITYLRLSLDDDNDDENVAEYEKRRNFIFWTGERDPETGKRGYIRIPKAEQLAGFLRVFEIAMEKEIKGEGAFKNWTREDWNALRESFGMFVPVTDVGSFVPAPIQSLMAYVYNYDMFRDTAVSYDMGDVLPETEGVDSERIEYFYKALGSAMGASPARMKAAVEKLTTTPSNSIVVSLAYGMADILAYGTTNLGEEVKSKSKKSSAYQLIKALNPKERFIKESNPDLKKYQNDMTAKEMRMEEGTKMKMLKIQVDNYSDALANKEMTFSEVIKSIEEITDEPYLRKSLVSWVRRGAQRKQLGITSIHFDVYNERTPKMQAYYLVKYFDDKDSIEDEIRRLRKIGFRPARGLEAEIDKLINNQ